MAGKRRLQIPPEQLKQLYPAKTIEELAVLFECGQTTIFKQLKELGIETTKKHRKPWSDEARAKKSQAQIGRARKRSGATKKCGACGTDFYVIPARAATAKYCSNKCRAEGLAKTQQGANHPRYIADVVREKTCAGCGALMVHTPPQPITTFQTQKFCTKACADTHGLRHSGEAHALFKGEEARHRNRPANVSRWAQKVLLRDSFTCQRCGAAGEEVSLQAHHVRPYETFPAGRVDVNNGVTLCAECHWHVHQSRDPDFLDLSFVAKPEASEPKKLLVDGEVRQGKRYGHQTRKWMGVCYWCGRNIEKRLSDVTGKRAVFCGRSCSVSHTRTFSDWRPSQKPPPATARPPERQPLDGESKPIPLRDDDPST